MDIGRIGGECQACICARNATVWGYLEDGTRIALCKYHRDVNKRGKREWRVVADDDDTAFGHAGWQRSLRDAGIDG